MNIIEALNIFNNSMTGIKSPATIKWYDAMLKGLVIAMGDIQINDVTLAMLRAYRADLASRKERFINHPNKPNKKGGLSQHTLACHVRVIKRLFKWLYSEEYTPNNPAAKLEMPPLPRPGRRGITEINRDAILEAVKDNPRDKALVLFLADTACRVGGVSWLHIADLELNGRRAVVNEKGLGGRGKSRVVFFTERTAQALREWLLKRPDIPDCDYVFVGKCKRLTETGVYQVLKRAAVPLGIKSGFNPHSFRHGSIRGLLSNGMSLPEVSQIAGHSSTQVTGDIYGCFNEEELQRHFDKTSWLRDKTQG